VPVSDLNNSPDTCTEVPMPGEPKLSLFGLAGEHGAEKKGLGGSSALRGSWLYDQVQDTERG
jgi:hypothetical protein